MKYIKKFIKVIFFVSLALYIFLIFKKPPLPERSEIVMEVTNVEPQQIKIEKEPITKTIKGFKYSLAPRSSYELYGLVVSLYDTENWLDVSHKQDPGNIKDICVVWGENIKNGTYQKVNFESWEFTCFYRWKEKLDPPFSDRYGSNNHLIPATDSIKTLIKKASIGDQIFIKGYLVDYNVYKDGIEVYNRSTSTTRDDKGKGACEIIYVEDFKILEESNIYYRYLKRFVPYFLIGSFISLVIFFFKT